LKCSKPASQTVVSTTPQSGTTYAPSTGDPGADAWILSLAASRAKTSHAPANALALKVRALASGMKCSASLAKCDPDSCSWRTCQASLLPGERWEPFSGAWPRAGMMCCGTAYRRRSAVPRTGGTGGGLWRTPTREDSQDRAFARNNRGEPKLSAQVKWGKDAMWPTPTAAKRDATPKRFMRGNLNLAAAVAMWRTPSTMDANGVFKRKGKVLTGRKATDPQVNLADQVAAWTTPCASDTGHRKKQYPQGGTALSTQAGGQLNAVFVEFLMNLPSDWTKVG